MRTSAGLRLSGATKRKISEKSTEISIRPIITLYANKSDVLTDEYNIRRDRNIVPDISSLVDEAYVR